MFAVRNVGPEELLSEAGALLVQREAENNLVLGLADRFRGVPHPAPGTIWLVVSNGNEIVGAAARTAPHYVTVSRLPEGAAAAVARWFIERGEVPDGASGPGQHGRDVALALAAHRGDAVMLRMADTVYELNELNELNETVSPPGLPRLAAPGDVAIVARFYDDFFREAALPHTPDPARAAASGVAAGAVLVWDHDGPRSVAATSRRTPSGATIGPVYTPPEARGRGYATALTAALARRLLDLGRRSVFLFADRNNATSNHIYRTIGFRPLGDFDSWVVVPRAEPRVDELPVDYFP